MNASEGTVRTGDVLEFTHRGERRTAEAMLVSDGVVLLDLFDGERPAWAHVATLSDLAVYRPTEADVLSAA